ncbi:hypothetical protein LINPERPRIM_LOCUS3801, partial [Linum perenne]
SFEGFLNQGFKGKGIFTSTGLRSLHHGIGTETSTVRRS